METPAEYATNGTYKVRDARTEKRFFVDNVIIRAYGPILGVYGVAVYNALCVHANKETQQGFPAHRTIAALLNCSVDKVKESIQLCIKLKLVHSRPRYDKKTHRQTSNLYTLLDPPPIPDSPVLTDTPPRNAEAATNNPHLDQSYLKEEPPPADSPPADDSVYVEKSGDPPEDATLWPSGPAPTTNLPTTGPPWTTEPIPGTAGNLWPDDRSSTNEKTTAAQFKARHATTPEGLHQETVTARSKVDHPDFTDPTKDDDPWLDRPVKEWCAFIRLPYDEQSIGRKRMLAGDLRAIAASVEKGPAETSEAIRKMTKSASCEWLRSAGRPTHREFGNVLLNVLCGQTLPEQRNGGSSTPRPQPSEITFEEPTWLGVTV